MKKTKVKKILIAMVALIILIALSGFIYAETAPKTTIICEDIKLYEALSQNLDEYIYSKDRDTKTIEIFTSDMSSIKEIDIPNAQIVSLTGLEQFTSVETLNLSGNSIRKIEPISNLTSIKNLNISGNKVEITDISKISNLTNVIQLKLASSQITSVDFMSNFTNLQELDVSSNGISSLEPIKKLKKLDKLNISRNNSFSRLEDILVHGNLTELDISETGLTTLEGIETHLMSLETLKVRYLEISLAPIVATYKVSTNAPVVPYLSELKTLDISNTTKSISFSSLALLPNLKELWMQDVIGKWKNSNVTTSLSLAGIYALPSIEYINLENNNIKSLDGFTKKKTVDGNIIIEDYLKAKQIYLQNNQISDLSEFQYLRQEIEELNLANNKISNIAPLYVCWFAKDKILNLTGQQISMQIFKKDSVDQYIILPNIFQESKRNGSLVYSDNTVFNTNTSDGFRVNEEEIYQQNNCYNVIIEKGKTTDAENKLQLTLNGSGIASGSVLTFTIGTSTGYIDSLLFKDEKLCNAIKKELDKPEHKSKITYLKNAHMILNLNHSGITQIDDLDLSVEDIKDLSGMENFTGLKKLNLSQNKIQTIDQLRYCKSMVNLNVSNNTLGNNNTAIAEMRSLTDLDLSNTNMTNIDSIKSLIDYWKSKKKFPLTYLNISNNGFTNQDIERIQEITSLIKLNVSNNKLNEVESLKPLKTKLSVLDISHNEITDIKALAEFTYITSLNLNNNDIKDISPVANITGISDLRFASNKVEDVSSLSNIAGFGTLTTLVMDNNKIKDISPVDRTQIKNELSSQYQKIVQVIPQNATGNITIPFPQIFTASKNLNSMFYSDSNMTFTNCKLSSDGTGVNINVENLGDNVAIARISAGKAKGTTLAIAAPIKTEITYNVEDMNKKVNTDITATIKFLTTTREVTITNNGGKDAYKFTQNGEFTFEFMDEYGFEGTATAVVNNIDKEKPQYEINQTLVDKKVIVTIKVNEPILDINGWKKETLQDGTIQLTKTYEESANEQISLIDEATNTTTVSIEVKIDKTAPVISGVVDGQKYNQSVTPIIQDENLSIVILTKDGTQVADYKSGDEIKSKGKYKLTATDTFGNTTIISFEIEQVSDIITSSVYQVDEEKLFIGEIKPDTTVDEIKKNIQNQMEYTILDKKGNVVQDSAKLGTGYQIEMENGKKYTIAVWGDLNGDAKVNILDVARLQKIVAGIINATDLEGLASDLKSDNKINLLDLARIQKVATGQNIL